MPIIPVPASGGAPIIPYLKKSIRLVRFGCKNRYFFHIVVMDVSLLRVSINFVGKTFILCHNICLVPCELYRRRKIKVTDALSKLVPTIPCQMRKTSKSLHLTMSGYVIGWEKVLHSQTALLSY